MDITAVIALINTVAPLIEKYGVPAVAQLVGMFSRVGGPSQADWDTLKTQTATTARQQMLMTLAAHGIDPASPQGVALLALTPV